MKLLFLADASSRHTRRWINYFLGQNHRCYLLSLEEGTQINAQQYQVRPRIKIKGLSYPSSYFEVKRIVGQIKPDLINAHFVPNYGLLGALLNFKPFVASAWGSDILISAQKSILHKFRARFVLSRADVILSDSLFLTQKISELGISQENILTFPLGIEIEKYSPEKKKGKILTVLSTRRLEPIYDVGTFIQAVPLVLEKSERETRFIIVGSGSQSKQLKKLAYDLRLQDKVEFKGNLSDEELIRTYRDSDIYVSTSLSDSTSVSLLEAMASGLIPIVTDIPGNREWIQDGKNGFLFSLSKHGALAEKIIHVANRFTQWQGFAEKNRAAVRSKAAWEVNMKAVERRFFRLVGRDNGTE